MLRHVAFMFLLLGCDRAALGGVGESCTKKADCADNLSCFDQKCVAGEAKPAVAAAETPAAATASAPAAASKAKTATPPTPAPQPTPPPTASAPVTPEPPTPPAIPTAPLTPAPEEKIGGLAVGMSSASAKALLPNAKANDRPRENIESGIYEQYWEDPAGIAFTLVSESRKGAQVIETVTIRAPSTLKSSRGIAVGDTLDAVKKAYGATDNVEDALDDSTFTYDTIEFGIDAGKVTYMSFGNIGYQGY